uniref:Uncharacterized protein n=1 Tax=Pyxicephalus adspersus TaxID=30357 RepID=A0AAV3AUN3_PYXAD|nr:TPA: hypothetical protein GDO54_006460 [Pyxicephalus adspersus]
MVCIDRYTLSCLINVQHMFRSGHVSQLPCYVSCHTHTARYRENYFVLAILLSVITVNVKEPGREGGWVVLFNPFWSLCDQGRGLSST